MENKNKSCEKTTDQSSNKSSISEKMKDIKQQQKNKSDNIIIAQKLNNRTNDRKSSIEHQIFRKEFVPVLKPIEIHLIPSKLRLNKLDLKKKKNKNNILHWSCPCSEVDSENDYKLNISDNSFDNSESSELSNNVNNKNKNKNGLKVIRKKFTQLKSDSIQKVMTKKDLKNTKLTKQFNYFDNNILSEEEKEESDKNSKIYKDSDADSFSLDLYEDNNNFHNYTMKQYDDNDNDNDNNNKKEKLKQTKSSNIVNNSIKNYESIINDEKFKIENEDKKRNRLYSVSILDTLKNKIKIDK